MTTKRKILYAASTESHLFRFHTEYIAHLRKDADVYLMTRGGSADFDIPFRKRLWSFSNLKNVFRIRKILRKEKFDLVILNTTLASAMIRAAMIGLRNRPRVLNIVHGYLFPFPVRGFRHRILLRCEKLLRGVTDTVAVMNEEDLQIAKTYRLSRGETVLTHGMGVHVPDPMPEPAPELRQPFASEGDFLCTFAGELSARKNQIFLLPLIRRLRDAGIPAKLLLLGAGEAEPALRDGIRNLGLEHDVTLAGNRESVFPYLAVTDLYISPSIFEGLPFNIMEAMAVGLPIVASDVKGHRDLLAGTPGVLCPVDGSDAFFEAVKTVWEEKNYGVGSRRYPTLSDFTAESVFDEITELFAKEGKNC